MRPVFGRFSAFFAIILVVAACQAPNSTESPTPTSGFASASASVTPLPTGSRAATLPDMSDALLKNAIPNADVFELTREMRGRDGQPPAGLTPVRSSPPNEDVGTSLPFWTYDFSAKKNLHITATLRIITDHAKWWVQDDISVDTSALRQNANAFESQVYPTDRQLYGSEWSPGIDGDPRIDIMIARIPGAAAGYFNSSDELPLWVNEFSAQREMVYINSLAARAGTTYLTDILSHEFCHMIEFGRNKRSSIWFNEGHAQLCEQANGFGAPHAQSFLRLPDTQLNDWPELEQSQPYYGQAQIFLDFMRQHAGGDDLINAFIDHGIDTPADLDAVLKARGQKGLDDLYADFVAANAFIGFNSADAATAWTKAPAQNAAAPTDQDKVSSGGKLASVVHNYAARYIELPKQSERITFTGGQRSRLLPTDPHSAATMWWSDRIDGLDSRMQRTIDMTKATSNTMTFWTWYEIEKDYDYGYVAVSTDGGKHWQTLPATTTTTDDPNGQNLGNGFTGTSGGDKPQWVKEDVDLSAYAGKQIQLRFEYVTDAALSLHGFAIDDISIPGVLTDDVESDGGWQANGFLRSTNLVAQRYVVQLLRWTDKGATVDRHIVDSGTVSIDVDTTNDRRPAYLAVTGLAVRTTEPINFQVSVDKR